MIKKMYTTLCLLLLLSVFAGCNRCCGDDDEDLITKPVTNNPHVVPSHGNSPFPISPSQLKPS